MIFIYAKDVLWERDSRAGSSLGTIISCFTQALLQDTHIWEVNLT